MKKTRPLAKVILLSLLLTVFAMNTTAQKVTLSFQNETFEKVLNSIKKQTGLSLVLSEQLVNLNRKVSIDAKTIEVGDALNQLLEGTNLGYEIKNNKLYLVEKKANDPLEANKKSKRITGSVTDENNQPIIGASIKIDETTIGTISDVNGKFSLDAPTDAKLIVSYIGYTTKIVSILEKTDFNIILTEDTKLLNEVIVVGYGTMKKSDLTGAITSISGNMIEERKSTQVSQALQGAMSGVTISRSGANGAMGGAEIKIRGVTTIGVNNPLVIIDGVQGGDVNQVNSADIESMTVLKDAASASIYGSQAAAGVILITTKRAKSDKASVNYTFETGFDNPTQLPKFVGAQRYLQMVNELNWNDTGNGANKYPTYPQADVDNYPANHLINPDLYPDVNMSDLLLKSNMPRETHMLSIMGGSNFVKSNVSFKYEKVGGFYDNKDYNRIFVRANNDFTINKLIGATVDLNFRRTTSTDPTYFLTRESQTPGLVLGAILNHAPIYPAVWANGGIADGKAGDNAYGSLKYGGNRTNHFNQLGGKISMDISPVSGLKITGLLAPVLNFDDGKTFNKRVDAFSATDPTQFLTTLHDPDQNNTTTFLSESRNISYSLSAQAFVNYDKSFGNHSITAMAGVESNYYKNEFLTASRDRYLFDTYPYLNQGPQSVINNSGGATEVASQSAFGRITYSYMSKYMVQANIRRDGSSRFNSKYRWGSYPSFSAGWTISEESFMKKQNVVDFLKLRASWGSLGNDRLLDINNQPAYYPSLGVMNFANAPMYQNNVVSFQQTAAQVQYAIPSISWEKTESSDIGLDAYFFKNRLKLTSDVYYKQTKDMLLALQIPIYIGFTNPLQNTGIMETKGIDLDLGWNDKIGKLRYAVSVNLSHYQSIMGDLGGTEFIGNTINRKGSEFNEWYGYLSQGIYQTQDDVTNSAKLNSNVKVGDMKYTDISGPDGIPDGKISPEYDRVLLGSSQPQWSYGGNLKLDYAGFDFSLAFQGIGKQLSGVVGNAYYLQAWGNFPTTMDGKYFSANNTPEQNLAAKYPRLTRTNIGSNTAMSDFNLFNGGYFRLKNLTLGYSLPKQFTQKAMINNLRVYVSGSDLWCSSNFPEGYDPEGLGIVTTLLAGVSVTF